MKKIITLIFTVVMILTATAQEYTKEEKYAMKDAVTYAESIAFVFADQNTGILKSALRTTLLTNPAFVFYTGNGFDARVEIQRAFDKILVPFSASDKVRCIELFDKKAYVTYAGDYVFLVPQKSSAIETLKTGAKKYEVETLVLNFRLGKYYTIDSRIDAEKNVVVDFSIKETDTNAYVAYQEANPNRFDGVWSSSEGKRKTTFSFDGKKMKFQEQNSKTVYIAEGSIMYNENTIIFTTEKAVEKGKAVKNANDMPYIWYYTLTDNVLHLKEGRTGRNVLENKFKWLSTVRPKLIKE